MLLQLVLELELVLVLVLVLVPVLVLVLVLALALVLKPVQPLVLVQVLALMPVVPVRVRVQAQWCLRRRFVSCCFARRRGWRTQATSVPQTRLPSRMPSLLHPTSEHRPVLAHPSEAGEGNQQTRCRHSLLRCERWTQRWCVARRALQRLATRNRPWRSRQRELWTACGVWLLVRILPR